jgi:hypothetical protein
MLHGCSSSGKRSFVQLARRARSKREEITEGRGTSGALAGSKRLTHRKRKTMYRSLHALCVGGKFYVEYAEGHG